MADLLTDDRHKLIRILLSCFKISGNFSKKAFFLLNKIAKHLLNLKLFKTKFQVYTKFKFFTNLNKIQNFAI